MASDGEIESDLPAGDDGNDAEDIEFGEVCPGLICGSECCGSQQRCVGGRCCDAEDVCGSTNCCADDEICIDGECWLDCGENPNCGDVCCDSGEVCHAGGCFTPGDTCNDPYDCPPDQYCEITLGRCMPRAGIDTTCEYRPPTEEFSPRIEWIWSGSTVEPAHDQVMMQPVVAQLTDDNRDGAIDEKDIPDIIFHTFSAATGYESNGVMRAISGDGRGEIFSVTEPAYRTRPDSSIAVADIDGDGYVEIVTCTEVGVEGIIAFEHDGTLKWHTRGGPPCRAAAPAIADVDRDGEPEIVIRRALLEADGSVVWYDASHPANAQREDAGGDFSTIADIDDDPQMEIIAGTTVYNHDGTVLWDRGLPTGYPAVGDLDGDTSPEVVVVQSRGSGVGSSWYDRPHYVTSFHADGRDFWGPVDINQGRPTPDGPAGGGPPTIADFDGDGRPEVAAAVAMVT